MVAAIHNVVRGKVGDGILVAQFVADVLKRLVQIVDVIRKKRAASGFLGEFLQNLVTVCQVIFAVRQFARIGLRERDPLCAGADGVDDHARALRHFDGVRARVRR